MRKERGTYVWIAPEFKKVLKKRAADENKSMISLTKEMAEEFGCEKKIKKDKFNPGF